jgi:hypothetical protein
LAIVAFLVKPLANAVTEVAAWVALADPPRSLLSWAMTPRTPRFAAAPPLECAGRSPELRHLPGEVFDLDGAELPLPGDLSHDLVGDLGLVGGVGSAWRSRRASAKHAIT